MNNGRHSALLMSRYNAEEQKNDRDFRKVQDYPMSALIESGAGQPFRSLDLPDAEVLFCSDFFPTAYADHLLRELLATIAWRQDVFRMYGREMPFPRLTAWFGDEGTAYTYSGLKNIPAPWT
jgi:hypothetical protein